MSEPIDINQLRSEVEAISRGVTFIRETGISERALTHLIQQACPSVRIGRSERKPPITLINAVLDGLDGLEEYVFGDTEEDRE